jgi:hypothetical protein
VVSEPKELTAREFIEKIENSPTWEMDINNPFVGIILLRVKGDDTVYSSPSMITMSKEEYQWFAPKITALARGVYDRFADERT